MISEIAETPYEIRIRKSRSWFQFDWRGIWEYRDLLFLLVRRDFISRFKQTILGPAWFVIQPLVTTLVFTLIFAKAAKISTDGLPPMLFYLCGMLAWGYFASTFGSTSATLVGNAGLFGKVYFPRLVIPLASMLSNLIAFAIQLVTFLGFWVFYRYFTAVGAQIEFRWQIVALPLLILHLGALSLGVGLWMSALTAKYRDFAQLSGFLLQLWMYGTPIIFPLSVIPPAWRWLVLLNPMTMPTEAFKYVLLGQGFCNAGYYTISAVITAVVLVTGQMIFQRVERTFVDVV